MVTDTSPRTSRFLPAEVMTSSLHVRGKIMVSSSGAIGNLNDSIHSVLEVHDAHVGRLGPTMQSVDHFEMIRLVKSGVGAVLIGRREDLGPQAVVRGGLANFVEYPVRIATRMIEIEGILEFPGRFDFSSLLTEGSREFVPVYNASIRGILAPDLQARGGGVLVNHRNIEFIALLNQLSKAQES